MSMEASASGTAVVALDQPQLENTSGKPNSNVLRKTFQFRVLKPDVTSLKTLARNMKKIQRTLFIGKYGKILDLLEVDVQVDALTALAQFYDPPFRCFTFQDFQLAPTLEEFGLILGFSLKNIVPYQYRVSSPPKNTTSKLLDIPEKEFKEKNGLFVLPRKYLEERATTLAKDEAWELFRETLALLIFGIILFPSLENCIDLAAIDVFLALKNRGENPVPAILADTYNTLDFRHEQGGGLILCCSPVLYVWLMGHTFLEDHQMKGKSKKEWANTLVSLNEKTIRWYSRSQGIEEVICKCGDFNNVPLMGTKGCINYNPSMALRQLGYPVLNIPTMKDFFVMRAYTTEHAPLMRRIRTSWQKIVKKGKELGPRSCHTNNTYRDWVKNRVLEIKLPFHRTISAPEEIIVEPFNSIEDLESDLAKKDQKIVELQKELEKLQQAYRDLKNEKDQQSVELENVHKTAREEEDKRMKIREGLWAANTELGKRNREKNMALFESSEYKKKLKVSYDKQNEYQETIDAYKTALAKKEEEVHQQEAIIEEMKREKTFWMDRFSELASLANSAINDVPRLFSAAPLEISGFIEHCKTLLRQMKELITS